MARPVVSARSRGGQLITVSGILVLVAIVLLAASFAGGSAPVYGAIAALLLAAGLLLAGLARRNP